MKNAAYSSGPTSKAVAITTLIILFVFAVPRTFGGQVVITPDNVDAPTFRSNDAICYGSYANTHINIGFGDSWTGTSGKDYKYCTIGGGEDNTAGGAFSTIGGGFNNTASDVDAVIGGGSDNRAYGEQSTVAGGFDNEAGGILSMVGGGGSNKASGKFSTVGGGFYNTAAGESASVGGGRQNTAGGDYSWAGGRYMQLSDTADQTFVWGYSDSEQAITSPNAFLIFPAGASGKVGVGTKNPKNLLDLGSGLGKKLAVYQNTAGTDFYGLGVSDYTLEIHAGSAVSDSPAMVVKKTTGRVGIGTVDPGYKLEVNGDAAKTDGGNWSVSSDVRLKDITGDYTQGLDEILCLKPITFFYKRDNRRGLPSDEEHIGFIAQEVRVTFPEAVNEGPDGYLDFNMHPVNVAMINAIKELKAENEALKAENASLKRDIEKIKTVLGITGKTGI